MRRRAALACGAAPVALIAGLLATALTPAGAAAQGKPTPATPAASQSAELGEVIVTARRRSENLARVPTSITAFSAEQLAERSIHNENDLQLSVPGLTLRQTEGNNLLTYAIRGQTVEAFTGSPTAVVPYINEVQLNTGGASSFYDLESIQVLKGPQGTLFGRNATGGAVLYTTTRPTNTTEGYLEARAGNLSMAELQGAFNAPLVTDKVLFRAAFDLAYRDGYIRNLFYDNHTGVTRRQSGRVSLTLKPVDGVSNTTVFEYDHAGGSSTGASYLYSINPCGVVNNGYALPCGEQLYTPAVFDSVFGPGAWNTYLAANPKVFPGGINAFFDEARRRGAFVTDSPIHSRHAENNWFISNASTYDLSGGAVIKNIFGASRSQSVDDVIETAEPYGVEYTENLARGEFGNAVTTRQLSDELQVQGSAADGQLTYIAGAYYQQTKTRVFYPQTFFTFQPFGMSTQNSHYALKDTTEALYAQGTYDLQRLTGVSGLRFTAGLRYTWEQVGLDRLATDKFYPAPHQKISFSDPSWDVGFEYQATPELMVYAKTRGSFRSGGRNGVPPPVDADASGGGNIFHPEHTHDVEAGLKFAGDIVGRPAHLNLAVYNQWIRDVQRLTIAPVDGRPLALTTNVPAAEVTGFEFDAVIQPASWLEAGVAGAHNDARYTKNQVSLFGQTFLFGPYADAPRWSGTAFVKFNLAADEQVGDVSLRFDAYAQTAQYFSNTDATLSPGTRLPGYHLVNARLDWNGVLNSPVSASAFVKNLFDKTYFSGGLSQGGSLGVNAAAVGEPRTYGVELKYRF